MLNNRGVDLVSVSHGADRSISARAPFWGRRITLRLGKSRAAEVDDPRSLRRSAGHNAGREFEIDLIDRKGNARKGCRYQHDCRSDRAQARAIGPVLAAPELRTGPAQHQAFAPPGRSALQDTGNGRQGNLGSPAGVQSLRGTMVESAKRCDVLPRQISVKGTMQAVESFTPAMMAIDGNEAIYHAMLTTVSGIE